MIEHLFSGRPPFIIECDGFIIRWVSEPCLREVRFEVDGEEVCQIDYYGDVPSYLTNRTSSREEFMDFLFTNHKNIAEWLLFQF